MKKSLIFLLIIYGCSSYESITVDEGTLIFIEDTQLSQIEAYDIIIEWFAIKYNSANDVIQLADEEKGKIIGKGVGTFMLDVLGTIPQDFNYTIITRFKDNKVKIEFITGNQSGSGYRPQLRFKEDIFNYYVLIKNMIMHELETPSEDDF